MIAQLRIKAALTMIQELKRFLQRLCRKRHAKIGRVLAELHTRRSHFQTTEIHYLTRRGTLNSQPILEMAEDIRPLGLHENIFPRAPIKNLRTKARSHCRIMTGKSH